MHTANRCSGANLRGLLMCGRGAEGGRYWALGILAGGILLGGCSARGGGPQDSSEGLGISRSGLDDACSWDPGFNTQYCMLGSWWMEYSVEDATTATL